MWAEVNESNKKYILSSTQIVRQYTYLKSKSRSKLKIGIYNTDRFRLIYPRFKSTMKSSWMDIWNDNLEIPPTSLKWTVRVTACFNCTKKSNIFCDGETAYDVNFKWDAMPRIVSVWKPSCFEIRWKVFVWRDLTISIDYSVRYGNETNYKTKNIQSNVATFIPLFFSVYFKLQQWQMQNHIYFYEFSRFHKCVIHTIALRSTIPVLGRGQCVHHTICRWVAEHPRSSWGELWAVQAFSRWCLSFHWVVWSDCKKWLP